MRRAGTGEETCGEDDDDDHEVLPRNDDIVGNQEVENVCKGMEQGEDEVCKEIKGDGEDVKETNVQQNVDEVVEERVAEDEVVEDEVVEDEVVANKENEEVVSDEVVENILDDKFDNENVVKDATPTYENKGGEEHEETTIGGDDEEEQEAGENEHEHPGVNDDDPNQEEALIFMRTWLMEHAGYKQEDTQDWGLDKLKEEMNKVEIEIAMYDIMRMEGTKTPEKRQKQLGKKKKSTSPRSLEVRRKWKENLLEANVGYTMASLNRMGDERLMKELDNLKRLLGEKSFLKEVREHKATEKDDNDVDTLLATVPFLQTGDPTNKEDITQEKRIKTLSHALKSPYATDAERYQMVFQSSVTGSDFYKVIFESFYTNIKLVANALDAFTELLNFEEQKRSPDFKFRLYGCIMLIRFLITLRDFCNASHGNIYGSTTTWKCGFDTEKELEKQTRHVTELRYKYVSKILLSDLNNYKNQLLDYAKEFSKSMEGKKQDPKRDLFKELMARQDETF
ncbi:hypothetical protein L1987_16030 [Smallanthus sonchifolius]|uniref:Uncharacterized protein n=1 Tax=Smallanthus sonchifolius TaxID=185202 RepID=A0ACB9J7L1_9ASTR|nr:hypothetical protein L1987_16030 [Smallanthus sonchifolius]